MELFPIPKSRRVLSVNLRSSRHFFSLLETNPEGHRGDQLLPTLLLPKSGNPALGQAEEQQGNGMGTMGVCSVHERMRSSTAIQNKAGTA